MSTLDEFKKQWEQQKPSAIEKSVDEFSMDKLIRAREKKQLNIAMRYFWASLTYQILVYAMLSHGVVRYSHNMEIVLASLVGIGLFIPFTFSLIRKYKVLATIKSGPGISGMYDQIKSRIEVLSGFLQFKQRYELILIPLSCLIGVVLTFRIFIPGDVMDYLNEMVVVFTITLLSCIAAIRKENRNNFKKPIEELNLLLNEFEPSTDH